VVDTLYELQKAIVDSEDYEQVLDTLYFAEGSGGSAVGKVCEYYKGLDKEENQVLEEVIKLYCEESPNLETYVRENKRTVKKLMKGTLDYILKDSLYSEGEKRGFNKMMNVITTCLFITQAATFYLLTTRIRIGPISDNLLEEPLMILTYSLMFTTILGLIYLGVCMYRSRNSYLKRDYKRMIRRKTNKLYKHLVHPKVRNTYIKQQSLINSYGRHSRLHKKART
jgi:hypothetical protein